MQYSILCCHTTVLFPPLSLMLHIRAYVWKKKKKDIPECSSLICSTKRKPAWCNINLKSCSDWAVSQKGSCKRNCREFMHQKQSVAPMLLRMFPKTCSHWNANRELISAHVASHAHTFLSSLQNRIRVQQAIFCPEVCLTRMSSF